MCKRYGRYKPTNFPQRMLNMSFGDLMQLENQLVNDFGFSRQELKHLVKSKPTLLFYKEEYEKHKTGPLALKNVFCDQMGYS